MDIKKQILDYFDGDELAASTFRNKYALNDEETPDMMHDRLAKEFARMNNKIQSKNKENEDLSDYGRLRPFLTEEYIKLLFKDFKYIIPGGSVMAGLGTGKNVSLSNCFVLGSPNDSYTDIMLKRTEQATLMKRRGGVGKDLSKLRPKGASVNNAAKFSSGAASFMEVDSAITKETAQEGRRGALMLSMDIRHPDILEFIEKKQDLSKVTGANVSVQVTDEFMRAVAANKDFILRYPIDLDLTEYKDEINMAEFDTLTFVGSANSNKYIRIIKASVYWEKLVKCAWKSAEPGIMFNGEMVNGSPDSIYEKYRMICTNPCGEIPLGPYDSCRLLHTNFVAFVLNAFTNEAKFDFELLYNVAYEAQVLADCMCSLEAEHIDTIMTACIDDKIEWNLWKKIKDTCESGRRTGVGFTGLADAVAMMNLNYNSPEGVELVSKISKIWANALFDATTDMAIQIGSFKDCNLKKLAKMNYKIPQDDSYSWYRRLFLNDEARFEKLCKYGSRNISWSTVAPTGTVSLMARTSSGIEPVFMPFYERSRKVMGDEPFDYKDGNGEKFKKFVVVHPGLQQYAKVHGFVANTLNDWTAIYNSSPYKGATAQEFHWHTRVEVQSVIQKNVTHSISSTVNLPKEAAIDVINDIYVEAWANKLKGITVYRDGCRSGILNKIMDKPKTVFEVLKRPKVLEADFYAIKVKKEQFIVLVGLMHGKPYEIFAFRPTNEIQVLPHKGTITKVKKKQYSFDSEFIKLSNIELASDKIEEISTTLYCSMLLRHNIEIGQLTKVVKKTNPNITSFSSAVCRILNKYATKEEIKGEVCPDCGGRLIREAGCIKCLDCDYSKCL